MCNNVRAAVISELHQILSLSVSVITFTALIHSRAPTITRGDFMCLFSGRARSCTEKQEVCRVISASRHVSPAARFAPHKHTSTSSFFTFPPRSQRTANICFYPEQEDAEHCCWTGVCVCVCSHFTASRYSQEIHKKRVRRDTIMRQSIF